MGRQFILIRMIPFASMAAGLGIALMCLTPDCSVGASYPTRDVTLISPWAPGGMATIVAQEASKAAEKHLGSKIVVKNIPGGAGAIGTSEVMKAKPDGYMLILATSGPFAGGPAVAKVPYDPPWNFFDPVVQIGAMPFFLVVKRESPYKTLKDYVEAAKAKPNTITFGSTGVGSLHHFGVEKLQKEAGIKVKHVPFKGASELIPALLGGHVDSVSTEPMNIPQYLKDGSMRALCVFNEKRFAPYPEVPTAKELGYHSIIGGWNGVATPKGTAQAIINKLIEAYTKGMKEPAFISAMEKINYPIEYLGPKEFGERWVKDYNLVGEMAKAIGIVKQ
jgi:tripartite-type tricarboxylate transporter receptor subunit TctC